jgi:hypothetical protein
MAILTRRDLATVTQQVMQGQIIANASHSFEKTACITSVFLSHSHYDKDVVMQAKSFFENLGIAVYIDWADKTMPEVPNGITAQNIKNKIAKENDKFVLLATNNAVNSKWCNWEVGIGDSFKLPSGKIAILPLADNNTDDWKGNEYLQIYPRIEYFNNNNNSYYFVVFPNGSKKNIVEWLQT